MRKICVINLKGGVGKTTTAAKLAAKYSLFENKKVALVTLDTYRIGAVEQISAYGRIINIPVEVAYSPEGTIKIFALTKTTDLEKLEAKSGTSILTLNSIIIGALEANMMLEEKLFSNVGDTLTDLFGMTVTVTGILSPTDTFIDDFHFVDEQSYNKIIGKENVLLIKFKDENTPKLFYLYDKTTSSDLKMILAEETYHYILSK